jgi:hypothetical protein
MLLLGTPAASAKDFRPGDLRICGAAHCRVVTEHAQARAFSAFLYGSSRVERVKTPRPGSPVFQLRLRDGFVAALLSANAVRVHGLYCERFQRGHWYRLPPSLRTVAAGLVPKRLRASVPRSC